MTTAHQPGTTNRRQKIIYIAGLPGSGTTILGLLLPQYGQAVGLGEVEPALRLKPDNPRDRNQLCTCGKRVVDCDVWAPVLNRAAGKSRAERHALLLQHCRESYPGAALIDASKTVKMLNKTWLSPELKDQVDIRVINIVRDYRGWSLTQQRKHYQRGGIARWKFLYWHCLAWYVRNRQRAREIRELDLPVMTLSYESLVFNQQEELKRIAEFTGLTLSNRADDPGRVHLHDCHGNSRVRKSSSNYTEMRYDYRWTLDTRFLLLAPLLIPIHRYWCAINENSGVVKLNTTKAAFWQEKKV